MPSPERARLVVSGGREAPAKAFESELHTRGVEAEFILADVRHEDAVSNLVDRAVARFGPWTWPSTMPVPRGPMAPIMNDVARKAAGPGIAAVR